MWFISVDDSSGCAYCLLSRVSSSLLSVRYHEREAEFQNRVLARWSNNRSISCQQSAEGLWRQGLTGGMLDTGTHVHAQSPLHVAGTYFVLWLLDHGVRRRV